MTKRDKIWIIFLFFIIIFQYSETLFQNKTFFIRDLTFIFQPWKTAVCESLINGRMPLWDPYSYCGMPFMANFQSAVFYPFSVIFYIFGFIYGLKLFVVIHVFIAGLFLFLYLRSKKIKTSAAFTGGMLFAFGGYLITKIEFLSILGTAPWLPLILLLGTSDKNIFITALAVSFALLAGYPPVLLFIMILLLIELVSGNNLIKNIKKLILIILFTLIISSVQILPAMELVLNSVREKGLAIKEAVVWQADYSDWLSLISPVFLKEEATGLFTGEKYFWLRSFWIGFIATAVILFGFINNLSRPFLMTLCHIFNKNTEDTPNLTYRNWVKKGRDNRKFILYLLLIAFSAFFSFGNMTPFYNFVYNYIPGFNLIRAPAHILFIPFFIFVIFVSIQLNNFKKISLLFTFLIVFELLCYAYKIHPTIEHNFFYEKGIVTDFLQKDNELFRFFSTPKTAHSKKITVPDYKNIGWYVLRDRLYNLISVSFHLYNAGGVGEPLETKEHSDLILKIHNEKNADDANKLLSLMNVKYLLSEDYFASKKWTLVNKSHLFVYRNKNFIERSFVLDKNDVRRGAKISYYSPEKVKIETSSSGTLVFSDAFYPGWQAFVNGKKTGISPVNYIFRSIELNNLKNYKIIFLYNPVLFKIGLLISLLSICIIFICDISTLTSIQ
ncbi:MAG: YfhO family protein [Elusimicrobia bacterium]|nr:YfhO family protein [Elusimicrobiota bacterium]